MITLLASMPWNSIAEYGLKILFSFILTIPIALERERTTGRIGLRTFPLVAIASCGYVLLALDVIGLSPDAQARIIQGLMTGMGFIGGGAILREGSTVRGTSTAAGIWTTGIIGASMAYENYTIAVIISIVNYLVFRVFTPLVHHIDQRIDEQHDTTTSHNTHHTSEG